MSSIQFPEGTTVISAIDLIANSLNQVAILGEEYQSGVSLYIANNSPFTTALVNIQVSPNSNTNVNYNTLYSETIFLDPQEVLILSNIFNPQNTVINVTIDNTNNSVAYLVYNNEFSLLPINSINTLPIDALVNEQISTTPITSGSNDNYQILQQYVTNQINNLTSDVSYLSSLITNNFEELLNAESFQLEVLSLSSDITDLSTSTTNDVQNLSTYVESVVPSITAFLDVTAPQISSSLDLLSNQVLANYQTFTTEINNITEELSAYGTDIYYLQQNTSNLSSEIDNLSGEINSFTKLTSSNSNNLFTLQSEIDNITSDIDQIDTDIIHISLEIDSLSSAIDALSSYIDNITQESISYSDFNNLSSEVSNLETQVNGLSSQLSNDNSNLQSQLNSLSSALNTLSNSIDVEEINLLQTNVNTLFNDVNTTDNNIAINSSDITTISSTVNTISSDVNSVSSDISIVSGSLISGNLSPKFESIQRQIERMSQNWLPNSTFLYGLLMWNNSTAAAATTDTKMTALTYQSTDTSLQKIQSNPIAAQWINGSEQTFTLSAQISALITSSTPTIDVLCYDSSNNLLGSAATLEANIGTDYAPYIMTSTLLSNTAFVVIELSFSGDANTSYVGFSEIKFEYNNEATQWSDESSSLIINQLYSSVFGASSQVIVNR